jgi:hypothetical protein
MKRRMNKQKLREALHQVAERRDDLDELVREFKQEIADKFEMEVFPAIEALDAALAGASQLLQDEKEAA